MFSDFPFLAPNPSMPASPPSTGFARGPGPSRTSQSVALTRSGLIRPSTPAGDPDAQRRLCAGMEGAPSTGLRPALAARTRFFDDQVLAAIAAGTGQVVILGAGYDDRALRFRSPGVRFFEIDQPATQRDKVRRLRTLRTLGTNTEGVVMAPADFRSDDVGAALADCGHRAGSPSLFICEGLLVYLGQPTIVDLLGALNTRAAAGSMMAASLATHPEVLNSQHVTAVANTRRSHAGAEPWLTILPADLHLALLARTGWVVNRSTDSAQLDTGLAPGRSLLVTAHPGPVRSNPGR